MESVSISALLLLVICCQVFANEKPRRDGEGYVKDGLAWYNLVINRIRFDGIGGFPESVEVEEATYQVDKDHLSTDSYLFADGSAIKSYNTQTSQQYTVIGESSSKTYVGGDNEPAKFNQITSFLQINGTHILVADSMNHCLRMIDRPSQTTTTFAGLCGTAGYTDGEALFSRFNRPYKLFKPRGGSFNSFYVTDSGNNAIREISIGFNSIRTYKLLQDSPYGITRNRHRDYFYVTTPTTVIQIDRRDTLEAEDVFSSTTPGFQDGNFADVKFNQPRAIMDIEADTLLVADTGNNRIRIIDLSQRVVTSICSGEADGIKGDTGLGSCKIEKPLSFFEFGDPKDNNLIGTNSSGFGVLHYAKNAGYAKPKRTTQATRVQTSHQDSGEEEEKPEGLSSSMVIVVAVVTAGVVLIAIIAAVAVLLYKKSRNDQCDRQTANLDLAVKTAQVERQAWKYNNSDGTYTNPYDEYSIAEESYQALPDPRAYTALDADAMRDTPPAKRSTRYGPLPHRPNSVQARQKTAREIDANYYSSADIVAMGEDEELSANAATETKDEDQTTNGEDAKPDYGYIDFDGENVIHEEMTEEEEEEEEAAIEESNESKE